MTYRHFRHVSGRYVARRRKLIAHDERNLCNIGDIVLLRELGRRLSKRKTFEVAEFVKRAPVVAPQTLEQARAKAREEGLLNARPELEVQALRMVEAAE